MSKQTEALKLALEALNSYHGYMEPLTTIFGGPRVPAERSTTSKVEQAITAIREALAQSRSDDEQPAAIPQYITCPFCESQHVPGWLHDYNMDRMEQPVPPPECKTDAEQAHQAYMNATRRTGMKATPEMIAAGAQAARKYTEETGGNNLAVIWDAMWAAQPAQQQEPVAWKDLFWKLALILKCLPSTFPEANGHVLSKAQRLMDAEFTSPPTVQPRQRSKPLSNLTEDNIPAFPWVSQKPVAWMHTNAIGHVYFRKNPQDKTLNPVPLYTSPPASKPWVGLTEQERNDLEDYCEMIIGKAAFEAIEAKLREKNA